MTQGGRWSSRGSIHAACLRDMSLLDLNIQVYQLSFHAIVRDTLERKEKYRAGISGREISSLRKVARFSPGDISGCRQGSEDADGTAYCGKCVEQQILSDVVN